MPPYRAPCRQQAAKRVVKVSILYFGAFGDAMADGPREIEPGITLAALAEILAQESAAFSALYHKKGSRIALNHALADPQAVLQNGDIIAFLAPVSGG